MFPDAEKILGRERLEDLAEEMEDRVPQSPKRAVPAGGRQSSTRA